MRKVVRQEVYSSGALTMVTYKMFESVTTRRVKAGEELVVNYGPLYCECHVHSPPPAPTERPGRDTEPPQSSRETTNGEPTMWPADGKCR
jgi:hypothetical protein